jgi:hypothetical protein
LTYSTSLQSKYTCPKPKSDSYSDFCRTDIDRLIDQILLEEPLISESRKPQLKKLIESKRDLPPLIIHVELIEKQMEN